MPQGTVLVPLLLNVYINRLFSLNSEGHTIGYADVTVIFNKFKKESGILDRLQTFNYVPR